MSGLTHPHAPPAPGALRELQQTMVRRLFRLPREDALPLKLGQRRIYVLPTGAGLAFALALLVMLIASINYNLSLGYGLVFLLFGVGVASLFHAFRNLLHLNVASVRADAVFAGDDARFVVVLSNESAVPRHGLTLIAGNQRATCSALEANRRSELVLTRPTHHRGWLELGRLTIETRYPLGLVRAWSVVSPAARCLVYPAPEPSPPPLPSAGGEHSGQRTRGDGDDDFAGLRNHRNADSPRHVAWKVFARGGPLMTKRFSASDEGDCVLDWQTLPDTLNGEQRIARLTAWTVAATHAGRPFALKMPDTTLGPACGDGHGRTCLTRLALFGLGETMAETNTP